MPQMRTVGPVLAVLAAVLAGCTSAPVTTVNGSTPVPTSAGTTAPATTPPPGTVSLTGDVRAPTSITVAQLSGMPQQTIDVTYTSGQGPQHKKETGTLLADVLPATALATTDAKNDLLTFGVLAIGADGYAALVSYGEISPDFGNRGILLATAEDGGALARPRLVVPGDVKGGRYVSDLVELRVVRTAGRA